MRRGVAAIAAIRVILLAAPSGALALNYAPVDQPGPALSVPQATLDASLHCSGSLVGAPSAPVLFVPGTGGDPPDNFGWTWEPAFDALGIPWCDVTLPAHTTGDIQVAGEYVVNAIRTMYARAGRRISIIGHSQGGMLPRWAFRFWPDTRAMVDDDIGLAATNHGTYSSIPVCLPGCAEAVWQQTVGSEFIKALNSYQETFPGISYTEVYTHTDIVVTPNLDDTGSSSVHGGGGEITNVAIQDVCLLDVADHIYLGVVDNVAYRLAIDALTHSGPASPSRVGSSICLQPFMPGVDSADDLTRALNAAAALAVNTLTAPPVSAEPPLKCYVTASCPAGATVAVAKSKPKCKKRKRHKAHQGKKRACKKRKK
jgi:Putative serine esterase (DUF676)